MTYVIHIVGHVEAPIEDAKAIEGALHAKFTAALLEFRHVSGHGLLSASFWGQHVQESLNALPPPGSAVVATEQSRESIAASRAPKGDAPGSAVVMEEQDTEEIARLRTVGAGAAPGSVLAMEEQSADSIAASRVPRDGDPPGSAALYDNQAPVRVAEEPAEAPLVAVEVPAPVEDATPLPADGEILTDEATGQQYRFNATTLRLVKYAVPPEDAPVPGPASDAPTPPRGFHHDSKPPYDLVADESVSDAPTPDFAVNVDVPPVDLTSFVLGDDVTAEAAPQGPLNG